MRLYDPDTERLAELPPGPLHLHVEGPDLRAYLTADLLRRVAGRHRRVRVTSSGPPPPGRPLADYNILGVDIVAEAPTPHVRIGGPHRPNGLHLRPAPGLDPPPQDVDPVTLRLAVLSVPYRDPLDLPTGLPAAQRLLDQWRSLLTEWSRSPGRPISRPHATEAEAALTDDLNTPAALTTLHHLAEDPTVAPGAKLETFIHLDLLLALDLVRTLGTP